MVQARSTKLLLSGLITLGCGLNSGDSKNTRALEYLLQNDDGQILATMPYKVLEQFGVGSTLSVP